MAVLPIIVAPDPRLKSVSKPVEKVDENVRQLVADMFDTMYASNGVGLAAIQIGVAKRILVMDVTWGSNRYPAPEGQKPTYTPLVLINPEIIEESETEKSWEEGCLSFPGQYAEVWRPDLVTVKFLDIEGKEQVLKCDELLSVCLQHELDHLNGVTFVDHVSKTKRDIIMRKLTKQKKLEQENGTHA